MTELRNQNGEVVNKDGEAVCARCGMSRDDPERARCFGSWCNPGGAPYPQHIWRWQLEEQR